MLTLRTIASQLGVPADDLLATARDLDLPVDTVDSPVDAAVDWAIRKAMITDPSGGLGVAPLFVVGGRRAVRPRRESDLSDLAKVVLAARDADTFGRA